jgi:Hemerythrin HHE cation binding domain
MDAIQLLKADHKAVKALFRQFEEAGERAYQTKQRLAEQAMQELEVHAAIEEEIFYPALDARADRDGKKLVDEAVEEHHVVKVLIGELKRLAPEDDQFTAKFTVLTENVSITSRKKKGSYSPTLRCGSRTNSRSWGRGCSAARSS